MDKREYYEYLKTPEWAWKRKAKWKQQGWKCKDCGLFLPGSGTKGEVHHETYDRLGQELLQDLVGLCEYCHHQRHFGESKMQQMEREFDEFFRNRK
jgi:5-methylcytosine-specific restriction endonuclease McrA